MDYIVEPLLWELRDPVVNGLRSGELTRWGGGVRITKGYPGAGRFVAHLRELFPSDPARLAEAVSQKLQISSQLSAVMQLTQVAAAASVLTLGVSAVGFIVVAQKLNRLQASVDRMLAKQDKLYDDVMSGLAGVHDQLVELQLLALHGREQLHEALRLLREVRRDLLDGHMARMQMEAHSISRVAAPSDNALEQARRSFHESRLWLESGLARPMSRDLAGALDTMLRYRVWCTSVVLEVQVLRRAGARTESAALARAAAERSRILSSHCAMVLCPPAEMGGVFRYAHSGFESVPSEVRGRLLELQEGTRAPAGMHHRGLEAARAMSEQQPALAPTWFAEQRAVANVLDFLEETTERLESIADEMQFCNELRLPYAEWEALAAPKDANGLVVVRTTELAA